MVQPTIKYKGKEVILLHFLDINFGNTVNSARVDNTSARKTNGRIIPVKKP